MKAKEQDKAIEQAVDVIRKAMHVTAHNMARYNVGRMLARYAGVETPAEIIALDKAAEAEWANLRPVLRKLVEDVTVTEYHPRQPSQAPPENS
jgi:hypothetical protein